MQNIDVRFNASSNFAKVEADLGALRAEAEALGKTFENRAFASGPMIVDQKRWQAASRAVHETSGAFRNAAASSGLFTTQQIRATSEAEKYTKALQKQKLSFNDMRKNWGIMKQVYQDQLRYERMVATYRGSDLSGRGVTDIAIPKNVPQDLDTMRRKMGMFGNMAASAGTQIVNLGKNIQWSGRQLTVGFTYPMAMFGAAAGVMAYKVDNAFAQINKVYDFSAKAMKDQTQMEQEQGALRVRSIQLATDVAQKYGMAIEDTMKVEQELAATGFTGDKLAQYTEQVQRISALGSIDPSQTTDMVVALSTAFRKTIKDGKDMNDTLNFMNQVSNATSLSLQDIAEATPRAATGIAQLGGTAQDMTVLLVSMREAGVDAASGANALKSATTRIISPVKKATDFYDKFGISLKKLAKESGGNLFQYLRLLGQEQQKIVGKNEKQTALLRAQGVAALFGTYQNNRLTASLVNLTDAYGGVHNQTYKALQVMKETPEELQKVADANRKALMDNPAGRFRAEWQTLKIQLSEMGKPFLAAATEVLKAGTKIVSFFNAMPGWSKKTAMLVAAIMALAGPAVMLVGLFMNLFGQFVKGVGAVAKFLGISTLVTKEQKAEALATEAAEAAMKAQTGAAVTLAEELRVLTAALQESSKAADMYLMSEADGLGAVATEAETAAQAVVDGETRKQASIEKTIAVQQAAVEEAIAASRAAAQRGIYGEYAPPVIQAPTVVPRGQNLRAQALAGQQQVAVNEQVAALNAANTAEAAIVNKTNAELAVRNKVKDSISGSGIAMGVMGAAMAATLVTSNHVVDSIAKWAMIGTLAVPALKSMVSLGSGLASGVMSSVAAFKAAQAGAVATAGAMGTLKAGAMGFGAALDAALGPIGWIALGLTAAAGIFFAIKNHNDKIKAAQEELLRKQIAANQALQTSTASIATNMGKAAGSYQKIVGAKYSSTVGGGTNESQVLRAYNLYKGDDQKDQLAALQNGSGQLLDTDQLMDKVRQKFIDLQVLGNDTAKQAKNEITGMLIAAGASSQQAVAMAEDAFKHLGSVAKMDWTTPIKDQIKALQDIAGNSPLSSVGWSYTTGSAYATEIDPGVLKNLQTQASKLSDFLNQAIATAANPQQAKKYIDQFMNAALQEWNTGFDTIMKATGDGTDKARAVFAKYGVDSGKAFSDAWAHNADFKKDLTDLIGDPSVWSSGEYINAATKAGQAWEQAFVQPFATSSGIADNINNVTDALKGLASIPGLMPKQDEINNLLGSDLYKNFANIQSILNSVKSGQGGLSTWLYGGGDKGRAILNLTNQLNESGKALLPTVNAINAALGFKQGKNAMQALRYLMNGVAADAGNADNKVKGLGSSLNAIPGVKDIHINVNTAMVQQAVQDVQGMMADSAMAKFNSGWDSRMSAVQASQQSAQNALQNRQQDAMDAFDARWEKRKDAVTNAYQKRIDAIQREISAEQKADDTRQRLFENEKARLQALADLQNNTIDYNTAINQGNLDEAAKILNNSQAKTASDEMDAEEKAAAAAMQTKIDALNKKNDQLEKQRDKELKQMEKMEAKMRKHLERIQQMRANALQKEQQQVMNSLQKQRDAEEATLNARLDLFRAYTVTNQADLTRWIHKLGFTYDDFGKDITNKGKSWAVSFQTELQSHIIAAGVKAASDAQWKTIGKNMVEQLLKGFGFKDMAAFNKFVSTGVKSNDNGNSGNTETHHTGGVVGGGTGSRGNIPNTYKGLHRSEQMVRAQKGEYVINRKSSAQHKGLLDAINSGKYRGHDGVGGAGAMVGPGAVVEGAVANMFGTGMKKAFRNNFNKGKQQAQAAAALAGMYAGTAGTYGLASFSAEQMKNAGIIASVGANMGMSKRDLEIGIMTAITESTLRNLSGGDRDSVGLFQQRPSQGWGTPAQLQDPQYAARKFFSALQGVGNRNELSPWAAAQAVQRSAYADGSNYEKWWATAQSIFTKGLRHTKGGGYTPSGGAGGGYVAGGGGKHRPINGPVTNGLHDEYTGFPAVDFAGPVGRPVYAVADGTITKSYDIAGPLASDHYRGDGPYGSYGRVIYLKTNQGPSVLYAHLSRRSVAQGQQVRGGAVLGYSGNTGNSSGPHLHFGATNGPYAWLRRGGKIRYDNTPVIAHKGETMLSARLTKKFENNVASGGGDRYDISIDMRGAVIRDEVDIKKAVNAAIDERENKLGRRRVVKN